MNGEIPLYRQAWKRVPGEVEYFKGDDGLEAIFELCVSPHLVKTDHIFFAYIYPYSYNDMLFSIREVEYKCKQNDSIFYECQEIMRSLENRPMY